MPLRGTRAKLPESWDAGPARPQTGRYAGVASARSSARAHEAGLPSDVGTIPSPPFIDALPHAARVALKPQDELAEIIGFDAERESARAAYAFFAEPDAPDEEWLHAPPPPLPQATRYAMFATISMSAAMLLMLGGDVVYQRLVLPVPALAGHMHAVRLPSPLSVAAAEALARSAEPVAIAKPVAVAKPVAIVKPIALAPIAASQAVAVVRPIALATRVAASKRAAFVKPVAPAKVTAVRTQSLPAPAPSTRSTRPHAEVRLLLANAQAYAESGETQRAITTYETLLALSPDLPEALVDVATLELHRGDATRARAYAARATRYDQTNAAAWVALGGALEALHHVRKAHEAYSTCIKVGRGSYVFECARRLH